MMLFRFYLSMWAACCVILMTGVYFNIERDDPVTYDAMQRYPIRASALLVAMSALMALFWPLVLLISLATLIFCKKR